MEISATDFIQQMQKLLQSFGEEVEYSSNHPQEADFSLWFE